MFFTAIHQMMTENVDLTIVIRKANGQLTVATLPKSNGLKDEAQNHIVPLTVTGTPQELDAGFLQTVTRPIQKAGSLIANMAQFEAQADKAAANSKAAREAKSKESKEEREKREKYEKLMKKAEEMTTAKNYREALNLLGQAKSHANEAQLKGIEEKIQAVDKEMNKGSLFDLMERQPQPEQQPGTEPYTTAAGHAATTGLCPCPASSSKQATAKADSYATAGKTGIRTASCTAGTTTVRVVDATATGTAAGTPAPATASSLCFTKHRIRTGYVWNASGNGRMAG